jgi:acyl carrier protein
MSIIKQQVRQYIMENFLMDSEGRSLQDEDSFMEHHVVDSTGFLELVAFLESTFGFRIEDQEMVPENLDSLDNIDRFVHAKMAGVSQSGDL